MVLLSHVVLFALIALQNPGQSDRQAIRTAVVSHHGSDVKLTSILISGDFAVARGAGGVHEGLRLTRDGWHVVCEVGAGPPSAHFLKRSCGFSSVAAIELSAVEAANAAAVRGEFSTAAGSQRTAYQAALPSVKPSEAARLRLLNQLNLQMQLGQISRADAIRKWNEMRYSVYLP